VNCRSLGFARDDKGEGGASIGCAGSNDNLTSVVHSRCGERPAISRSPLSACSHSTCGPKVDTIPFPIMGFRGAGSEF